MIPINREQVIPKKKTNLQNDLTKKKKKTESKFSIF